MELKCEVALRCIVLYDLFTGIFCGAVLRDEPCVCETESDITSDNNELARRRAVQKNMQYREAATRLRGEFAQQFLGPIPN